MKVKKLLADLENVFAATAFAEAGEFETARKIAKGDDDSGNTPRRTEARHGKHEHDEEIGTPYPSKA